MFIKLNNLNKIIEMESFEKNNLKNIENTEYRDNSVEQNR